MKDRIVQYPNRYKLTAVSGQNGVYDITQVPGTVTETGTPLNKGTLLSDDVASIYQLTGEDAVVNNALRKGLNLSSFMAFCANCNADSLDAAFGKGNENIIRNIGQQLAMYAWFKGSSKTTYPFKELLKCHTVQDILNNNSAFNEVFENQYTWDIVYTGTYARGRLGAKAPDIVLFNNGVSSPYFDASGMIKNLHNSNCSASIGNTIFFRHETDSTEYVGSTIEIPITLPISLSRRYAYVKVTFGESWLGRSWEGPRLSISFDNVHLAGKQNSTEKTIYLTGETLQSEDIKSYLETTPVRKFEVYISNAAYSGGTYGATININKIVMSVLP